MPIIDSPWDTCGTCWIEEHVDWDYIPDTADDAEHDCEASEFADEDDVEVGPPTWQERHVIVFCSMFCQHKFQEHRL